MSTEPSRLNHKEIAVVSGLLISLAGATCSTPQMIITKLTGHLFTTDEADQLLKAVSVMDSVFSGIVDDMLKDWGLLPCPPDAT